MKTRAKRRQHLLRFKKKAVSISHMRFYNGGAADITLANHLACSSLYISPRRYGNSSYERLTRPERASLLELKDE